MSFLRSLASWWNGSNVAKEEEDRQRQEAVKREKERAEERERYANDAKKKADDEIERQKKAAEAETEKIKKAQMDKVKEAVAKHNKEKEENIKKLEKVQEELLKNTQELIAEKKKDGGKKVKERSDELEKKQKELEESKNLLTAEVNDFMTSQQRSEEKRQANMMRLAKEAEDQLKNHQEKILNIREEGNKKVLEVEKKKDEIEAASARTIKEYQKLAIAQENMRMSNALQLQEAQDQENRFEIFRAQCTRVRNSYSDFKMEVNSISSLLTRCADQIDTKRKLKESPEFGSVERRLRELRQTSINFTYVGSDDEAGFKERIGQLQDLCNKVENLNNEMVSKMDEYEDWVEAINDDISKKCSITDLMKQTKELMTKMDVLVQEFNVVAVDRIGAVLAIQANNLVISNKMIGIEAAPLKIEKQQIGRIMNVTETEDETNGEEIHPKNIEEPDD